MANLSEQERQEEALSNRFDALFGTWLPERNIEASIKRIIDMVGGVLGLVLLSIPFLLAVAVIKLDSPGPVFFVAKRVGRSGRLFPHIKFRTMEDFSLSKGDGYTVSRNDARITRVGRFLRIWSVDELPNLLNVVRGEMSLVGPRPNWPHEVLALDDVQLGKVRMRPGLTGLAAISGRNLLPWDRRIEMDNWYIDHWSLRLDLKIVLLTPYKVATREGVYGPSGVNPSITPHPKTSSMETAQGGRAASEEEAVRAGR